MEKLRVKAIGLLEWVSVSLRAKINLRRRRAFGKLNSLTSLRNMTIRTEEQDERKCLVAYLEMSKLAFFHAGVILKAHSVKSKPRHLQQVDNIRLEKTTTCNLISHTHTRTCAHTNTHYRESE